MRDQHGTRLDEIRSYWGTALKQLPNLHFDLIDTYVSPDSIVVF